MHIAHCEAQDTPRALLLYRIQKQVARHGVEAHARLIGEQHAPPHPLLSPNARSVYRELYSSLSRTGGDKASQNPFFFHYTAEAACTAPITGLAENNIIQEIADVDCEGKCLTKCLLEDQCTFYTYYRKNDTLFSGSCFLLSALKDPVECQGNTCATGRRDGQCCGYYINGARQD